MAFCEHHGRDRGCPLSDDTFGKFLAENTAPLRDAVVSVGFGVGVVDPLSVSVDLAPEVCVLLFGLPPSRKVFSRQEWIEDPRLGPLNLILNEMPFTLIDNGHTIMINYAPGSSIRVGDKQYVLKQFHFHRPSEEKINGKTYEMVVHLVHADQDGNLAVVAILLEGGKDNPLIKELWNDLPKEKEKEERLDTITINAANLLPADPSYYTFSGSLTTPPCSENVTWFVLKRPVSVSASEIEQFSRLYRNDARPTQPLYDRDVLESQ